MKLGGGGKCLSKALLEFLAGERRDKNPLEVYRLFLRHTLNLNISHGNLSDLPDSLLAKFYISGRPDKSPKYFNLFRYGSLAHLEQALGIRIVIAKRIYKEGRNHVKIHDRRIYDDIMEEGAKRDKTIYLG